MVGKGGDDNTNIARVGWIRSFTLALKSTIIGLLFAFVWVIMYTITRYCLYGLEYTEFLGGLLLILDFGQILLIDFVNLVFFMPFQMSGVLESHIVDL